MNQWTYRPARDHGLPPAARLRSIGREPGIGGLLTTALWQAVTRLYLRLLHRYRVEGRTNLPPPPFVLVGNHGSHLDALALSAALPRRLAARAFALAAGDTFFTSAASSAFAAYFVNALPVWRRRTSARDLDGLRARLHQDGAVLILFPEGTRSRTGAMGPFRPGVGALVAGTAVPVVPCHLGGAWEAWPPGRRLPRPGPLLLRIGAPLDMSDLTADRAGQAAVAARAESAVRALASTQDPWGA